MDIDDYIYSIKIIKELLNANRIKECKILLDGYKISFEAIKKLLSILDNIKIHIPGDYNIQNFVRGN
jgi:pyridoxal/pyridoxine/pyridoxamine kinase